MECLLHWAGERGTRVEPFGLDLSEKLVALARHRLPEHANNLCVGNALSWQPSRRFDYVRTELCYVPAELQKPYVLRLLEECVAPGGQLLVAEYRSRRGESQRPWVDHVLQAMGFSIGRVASGFWDGRELTRVACVRGRGPTDGARCATAGQPSEVPLDCGPRQ